MDKVNSVIRERERESTGFISISSAGLYFSLGLS